MLEIKLGKKRKGYVTVLTVFSVLAFVAFMGFTIDFGFIMHVRNTIKNNMELAGLEACARAIDIDKLRSEGKFALMYDDINGSTFNPFDTNTFPSYSSNPAENIVLNNFHESLPTFSKVLDTQNATLKIWIVPEGDSTTPFSFPSQNYIRYGRIYQEFTSKIYPFFMPVFGVGRNGMTFVVRTVTEVRPIDPSKNPLH